MGYPAKTLSPKDRKARFERWWISRLLALPEGAFEVTTRRMIKGDPLTAIAEDLHRVEPEIAEETFRRRLPILRKQVQAQLALGKSAEETVQAITDFNKARAEEVLEAEAPRGHSAGSHKRIKVAVTRAIKKLRGEDMLKYAWVIQQKRVDRMVDLEDRMDFIFPTGAKEVDALRAIGEAVVKMEMGSDTIKLKGRDVTGLYNPTQPYASKAAAVNPLVEGLSALDTVDRNLVIQIVDKFEKYALGEIEASQAAEKDAAKGMKDSESSSNDRGPESREK